MRARNIKPAFFKNDILADCDPIARILFAGLWCYADREGRFKWRPKRIKAEILPYDHCDIEDLLKQLSDRGFIIKYDINGKHYGCIPKFLNHQHPHCKEKHSKIAAPEKHNISPVQAPQMHGGIPSDSLISDSGLSDSLIPEKDKLESGDPLNPSSCPYEQIKELWNIKTTKFPKITKLSKTRRTRLAARWKENPGIKWWENLFVQMEKIPFLFGQNERRWVASFDWIVENDNNAVKVLEGSYDSVRASPGLIKAQREREAILTFDQE